MLINNFPPASFAICVRRYNSIDLSVDRVYTTFTPLRFVSIRLPSFNATSNVIFFSRVPRTPIQPDLFRHVRDQLQLHLISIVSRPLFELSAFMLLVSFFSSSSFSETDRVRSEIRRLLECRVICGLCLYYIWSYLKC